MTKKYISVAQASNRLNVSIDIIIVELGRQAIDV